MHYVNPPQNAPANVLHRTMYSRLLAHEIGYCVYVPPDYAQCSEAFPVVCHLHGWQGSESTEIHAMEGVYRSRRAITVFPNSSPVIEDRERLPVEDFVLQEFLPHIDREYRTSAARDGRMLSGFSMGGGAALYYAVKHPELFGGVTAYAGTYHHYLEQGFLTVGAPCERAEEFRQKILRSPERTQDNILSLLNKNADRIRGRLRLELRVGSEDVLHCENDILHLHLNELGIQHSYIEIGGAGHTLDSIVYRAGFC